MLAAAFAPRPSLSPLQARAAGTLPGRARRARPPRLSTARPRRPAPHRSSRTASGSGMYLQPDPLISSSPGFGEPVYAYAMNNPMLFWDIMALCSACDDFPNGRSFDQCFQEELRRQMGPDLTAACLAWASTCSAACLAQSPQCTACWVGWMATCGVVGWTDASQAAGWCSAESGRCNRSPIR